MKDTDIKFIVVDLFCGAGGVTTGFTQSGVAKVIVCINHDANAIRSHAANHPDCHHFTEDIRHVKIKELIPYIEDAKLKYPNAKLLLWASAECTNFSNAKGGASRDADSRSLANDLVSYVDILCPDYFLVENVREFMSWGDIDNDGKPISKKNGLLYMRWVKAIQKHGYLYDWRILNSADFGAYQSRERYFGMFAKGDLPIRFPTPTHVKRELLSGMFSDNRKPHKAVKDVLELENIGNSIFSRKKPLVDNTLLRILKGLRKYSNKDMIMRNNNPGYCRELSKPIGTITCKDTNYIIRPSHVQGYFGNAENNPRIKGLHEPSPTVTTQGRYGLVSLREHWIDRAFGGGGQTSNINNPCGAITARQVTGLATAQWLDRQYSGGGQHSSIERPCGTLTTKNKTSLATSRYFKLLHNLKHLEDKEGDTETMRELKAYCRTHGIADVFLRMLTQTELLRIQGFPSDYKLIGSSAETAKYIGNAVEVNMATALALGLALEDEYEYFNAVHLAA